MKNFKRLFTVMLTLVLTFGLAITTANAADIEIQQNGEDKGTHTYGAYQVLVGDIDNAGVLSNVQWGSAVNAEDGKVNGETARDFAERLATLKGDAATAAIEAVLGDKATATATASGKGNVTITGLDKGYYFVKDESAPTGTPASMTKFIAKLVDTNKVTVNAKSSVPSVEKKVQDINESKEDTLTNLQDSADYAIGDNVPYTVTATIGSGIDNYKAYSFQFVDTMSKGLTLKQNTWDIKVNGKSIKSLFTLTSAAGADGATVWTWAAKDIKPEVTDGSKVVLTYDCELNANAVIGAAGNPNTVKLKFDNNPNNCGEGKPDGETPEDKNIVFTYKTIVNKVNEKKDPLKGAQFTLEKVMKNGSKKPITTITVVDDTSFQFNGLDDGDYVLTETVTPAGYNTVAPINFTITATHDTVADDPQLKTLDGGNIFTGDVDAGTLTGEVVNEKGVTLPETGGIGTTLFYVFGGLLLGAGAILLVTKKRMAE